MTNKLRLEVNSVSKDFEWQGFSLAKDGSNRSATKLTLLWSNVSNYDVNVDGKPTSFDKIEFFDENEVIVFSGFIGKINKAWITEKDDLAFSVEVYPRYAILAYRHFTRATPYRAIPRSRDMYFDTLVKTIFKDFLEPEGFTAKFNTETNQVDAIGTIDGAINEDDIDVVVDSNAPTVNISFDDIGVKNITDTDSPNENIPAIGRIVFFAPKETTNVLQILDDLAEKSGYIWRIDADKQFFFFKPSEDGVTIFDLDRSSQISDISFEDTINKFRNETVLNGGDTTLFKEEIIKVEFDGQRTFITTLRLATILDLRVDRLVGTDFIVIDEDDPEGLVNPNLIKIKGIDEPRKSWEYEPDTRTIIQLTEAIDNGNTIESTCVTTDVLCVSLNDLAEGDLITIRGLFFNPVKLTQKRLDKVEEIKQKIGGTGIVQFIEDRPDIRTFGLALKTTEGLLTKYGNTHEVYSFRLKTTDPGVLSYKLGNLISVNNHPLIPTGVYAISELDYTLLGPGLIEVQFGMNRFANPETWREYWKDIREVSGVFAEGSQTEFTTSLDENISLSEVYLVTSYVRIVMYPASETGDLGGISGVMMYDNYSPSYGLYIY